MVCSAGTNTCVTAGQDSGQPGQEAGADQGQPAKEAGADGGLDAQLDQVQPDISSDLGPDLGQDAAGDLGQIDGPKKAIGAKCQAAIQCASGFCADGTCCDKACSGSCEKCNLAGKAGKCSPLIDGSACGKSQCVDNASASVKTTYACSAGQCKAVQKDCGKLRCDAAKAACLAACLPGKAQCVAKHYCASGACVPLLKNGAACTDKASCESGICHAKDKVCCDKACAGECESCALSATKGSCKPRPQGAACAKPSTCTNSAGASEVLTRQCDGSSSACKETKSSCAPFTCTAGAAPKCLTACSKNDQCLAQVCDLVDKVGTCPKKADVCYVDAKGSTPANGTLAKPYPKLLDCLAITQMPYVAVAAGTYTRSGTAPLNKKIIIARKAAQVNTGGTPAVKIVSTKAQPVFTLSGGENHFSGVEFSATVSGQSLIHMVKHRSKFHDCLFTDHSGAHPYRHAIKGASTGSPTTVWLTLSDSKVTGATDHALHMVDSMVTVTRSESSGNKGNGLYFEDDTGSGYVLNLKQVTLSNNLGNGLACKGGKINADRLTTVGNGTPGGAGAGVVLVNIISANIYNLLSAYNLKGLHCIDDKFQTGTVLAYATIAFNKDMEVLSPATSATAVNFHDSIIWNTSGTVLSGGGYLFEYSNVASPGSATVPTGPGNINQAPMFVDTTKAKLNLRLQTGSPCINSGTPSPSHKPKTDLAGNPRFKGVVDMGAYEKQ